MAAVANRSGSPSAVRAPSETRAPLLIYSATLTLAVFGTAEALDAVERLARERRGYLVRRNDASITIRVPAESFEEALSGVSKLGDELHRVATFVATKQLVQVPRALQDARELCEWLLPGQVNPVRSVLEDLSHRLQIWRTNWPRLQSELGFRLAVARELRLWGQQVSTANVKRKSTHKKSS